MDKEIKKQFDVFDARIGISTVEIDAIIMVCIEKKLFTFDELKQSVDNVIKQLDEKAKKEGLK